MLQNRSTRHAISPFALEPDFMSSPGPERVAGKVQYEKLPGNHFTPLTQVCGGCFSLSRKRQLFLNRKTKYFFSVGKGHGF